MRAERENGRERERERERERKEGREGADGGNEGGERRGGFREVGYSGGYSRATAEQIKTCQSNAISVRNLIVTLIKIASGEEACAHAEVRGRHGEMRVCWRGCWAGTPPRVARARFLPMEHRHFACCCTMSNNRQCI